jgi:hypothetical protein
LNEHHEGAILTGPNQPPEAVGEPAADELTGVAVSRYLLRPIVFLEPDRLVPPASWLEHIPFAFWIVDALRPETLVELGTHTGNSYAAFAQAVRELGCPTACYAIDTWEGDPHAGFYGENVFEEWRAYHDRQFSAFSRLIRARFDDALLHFADGSVDLLHIDGYHTLDSVQADFDVWLPKMSARGVVLLHDINVRERDFGAWQLWDRLKQEYPSFTFLHGHGLGVLGVGRDFPEPVRWLLTRAAAPAEVSRIRDHFARLGRRIGRVHEAANTQSRTLVELRQRLAEEATRRLEFERTREQLESACASRDDAIRQLEARLHDESRARLEAERDAAEHEQDAAEVEAKLARTQALAGQLDADVRALLGRGPGGPAPRRRAGRTGSTLPSIPLAPAGGSPLRRVVEVVRSSPTVARLLLQSANRRGTARSLLELARRPRRMRDLHTIERSGLFDPAFYLQRNPDVAQSGLPPLLHYVLHGGIEGRQPHPLVDPVRYREMYPDVGRAGLDPLTHFLLHGAREERSPGPDFDTRYYLAANPDVRAANVNPLVHFVHVGWREGRNPSAAFDCRGYLARYEDVRARGLNPLLHFLQGGRAEGRDATPVTDATLPAPTRIQLRARELEPSPPGRPLVVCLTHVSPWPPHAGNAYRVHGMLRHFQAEGFRVVPVIVPLPNETPDDEAIREVLARFSNVVVVERDGRVRHQLRDVPDVLGSLDAEYTARYSALLDEEEARGAREHELLVHERTYCHDAAIAAMVRLDAALPPYVLLTEYVWMSRLLPLIGERAVKVIDTHDVYSTKADKVLKFGLPDLWLTPEEEAARLRRADLVVAIQDEERAVLQQLVPAGRVVTAGIDCSVAGRTQLPAERRALFVGSGNVLNARGLRDFCRYAWPAIRRRVPHAELVVAGAVCDTVTDAPDGVRLLGRVPDLDEHYANCRVVINPAVAGTGLKIKTVEALSRLRPLVTWPAGVDGLAPALRALCDVAADWYEFGTLVANRLDTIRHESFSEDERRAIEDATSTSRAYGELTDVIRQLLAERRTASATSARDGS